MVVKDLDKITQFVKYNQESTKLLLKEAPNITTWVSTARLL